MDYFDDYVFFCVFCVVECVVYGWEYFEEWKWGGEVKDNFFVFGYYCWVVNEEFEYWDVEGCEEDCFSV